MNRKTHRRMARSISRAVGWVWLLLAAAGADSPYLIDVWTPYRGLPQSRVLSIAQTPDGYLWVGMQRGWLASFDGLHFKEYNAANTPGLRSPEIQMLAVDRQGVLWIGDVDGRLLTRSAVGFQVRVGGKSDAPRRVLRYLGMAGDEHRFETESRELLRVGRGAEYEGAPQLARDFRTNSKVVQDSEGGLWHVSASGKFGRWAEGGPEPVDLGGARALDLCAGPEGGLWIGTSDGLWEWDGKSATRVAGVDEEIREVAAAPGGGVWVRSTTSVMRVRDGEVVTRADLPDMAAPPIYRPLEMHADSQGGLWILKYSSGVWHVDADGAADFLDGGNGLPGNLVEAWFEDREKNIWLGTAAGLARVRPRWFRNVGGNGTGPGSEVVSICEQDAGTMWLGRDNGLARYRQGVLEEIALPPAEQPRPISTVTVSPGAAPGELWIGTVQSGAMLLREGKIAHPFPVFQAGLAIRVIRKDPQGATWFGGEFGLFRWDGRELHKFGPAEGLSPGHIFDISFAADGGAWVAKADERLVRYRGGRFEPVALPGVRDGIRIYSLLSDDAGNVLLGTVGDGLIHLREGRVFQYGTAEGLPGSSVSQLLADDAGYVWGGTQQGIFRVSTSALAMAAKGVGQPFLFQTYDDSDGLPAAECSGGVQPACWKSADGHLWFSTTAGAVEVDPAEVRKNMVPPAVAIEEMRVGGDAVDLAGGRVEIAPGSHRYEFHFTGLTFTAPQKTRFRWQLTGVDTGWVDGRGQRSVAYSGLVPGNYRFAVQARNNDGVWSATPAAVDFHVRPHLWQRRSAQTAGILAAGALVALTVTGWNRRRHVRELQLLGYERGLEQQRFRHKQAMEAERARIAAELHDDLGANLTQIQWLGDAAPAAGEPAAAEAELRSRAARISRKSREMVRLIDEIVWAVNPKTDTLAQLATYVCNFAEQYFRDSPTRARIDVAEEIPAFPLEADVRHHLFLIAKEALHNVAKHGGTDRVWVRISYSGGVFRLVIEDHGKGFDPAVAEAGNGLANMRRRAGQAGAELAIDSSPGAGTRVTLQVPISPKNP